MQEFVELKVKMYSLKYSENGKTNKMKKAKGVKKRAVKKKISHENYRSYTFQNSKIYRTSNTLRSFWHQLL